METIIVICLLIIIFLLLRDKVVFVKKKSGAPVIKSNKKLDEGIMGKSRSTQKILHSVTDKQTTESSLENLQDNLEITDDISETSIKDISEILAEEEQRHSIYEDSGEDTDFAMGTTYEEVNQVAVVLKNTNVSVESISTQTVQSIQKIQGTELFSLLEESIEGASQKIAQLLDRSSIAPSSVNIRDDREDFDIGDFI